MTSSESDTQAAVGGLDSVASSSKMNFDVLAFGGCSCTDKLPSEGLESVPSTSVMSFGACPFT